MDRNDLKRYEPKYYLQDGNRIYLTKQWLNNDKIVLGWLRDNSLEHETQAISDETDWNELDNNAIYHFVSLKGPHAPSPRHIPREGIVFTPISQTGVQYNLVITTVGMAFRSTRSRWNYAGLSDKELTHDRHMMDSLADNQQSQSLDMAKLNNMYYHDQRTPLSLSVSGQFSSASAAISTNSADISHLSASAANDYSNNHSYAESNAVAVNNRSISQAASLAYDSLIGFNQLAAEINKDSMEHVSGIQSNASNLSNLTDSFDATILGISTTASSATQNVMNSLKAASASQASYQAKQASESAMVQSQINTGNAKTSAFESESASQSTSASESAARASESEASYYNSVQNAIQNEDISARTAALNSAQAQVNSYNISAAHSQTNSRANAASSAASFNNSMSNFYASISNSAGQVQTSLNTLNQSVAAHNAAVSAKISEINVDNENTRAQITTNSSNISSLNNKTAYYTTALFGSTATNASNIAKTNSYALNTGTSLANQANNDWNAYQNTARTVTNDHTRLNYVSNEAMMNSNQINVNSNAAVNDANTLSNRADNLQNQVNRLPTWDGVNNTANSLVAVASNFGSSAQNHAVTEAETTDQNYTNNVTSSVVNNDITEVRNQVNNVTNVVNSHPLMSSADNEADASNASTQNTSEIFIYPDS